MGWSLLGDVNNGWFANLAHGVEAAGRWVGNSVTGGSGGDAFYDGMARQADKVVTRINERAIDQALAGGATPHQALNAGSAAMERIADPQNISELATLGTAGAQTASGTVIEAVAPVMPDLSALVAAGALAVGGGIALCDGFLKPSPTPVLRREQRYMAA